MLWFALALGDFLTPEMKGCLDKTPVLCFTNGAQLLTPRLLLH